jgi:hypothetical protein
VIASPTWLANPKQVPAIVKLASPLEKQRYLVLIWAVGSRELGRSRLVVDGVEDDCLGYELPSARLGSHERTKHL